MNDREQLRLAPGETFADRFTIESEIGCGAYGRVYRAIDSITGEAVALKLLFSDKAEIPTARWREATMMRRLNIPGVARLIAEGVWEGQSFVAMKHLEGRPFPRPAEPLPWEMIEGYVASLLQTLALIHQSGIVHGDIKPSNVVVERTGEVKLVDFGLAVEAVANDIATQSLSGTPIYMAPELFRERRYTVQTDLFAVGVMVFEALTARPFFETTSVVEWFRRLSSEGPPTIRELVEEVDPVAEKLVDSLLALDPRERPESAWVALDIVQGGDGVIGDRWMGPDDEVEAVVGRLAEESVVVGGFEGSGRTWFVTEVARRLERRGRPVAFLTRGDRPFESILMAEKLDVEASGGLRLEELEAQVARSLEALIGEGVVVATLRERRWFDDWTNELLDRLAHGPGILRIDAPERADVVLERFTRKSLEELFHGPELALHLKSRAAAIVWARTLGWTSDVFSEIESWRMANLAQPELGRYRVNDRGLGLLEQGLRTRRPVSRRKLGAREFEMLQWLELAGRALTSEQIAGLSGMAVPEIERAIESLVSIRSVRPVDDAYALVRQPEPARMVGSFTLEEAQNRVMAAAFTENAQRLRLAIAQNRPELVYEFAVLRSDELIDEDQPDAAAVVLRETVVALQKAPLSRALFDDLLRRWTIAAASSMSPSLLEEILWCMRGDHPLREYVEAHRLLSVSTSQDNIDLLEAVPDTGNLILESMRRAAIIFAMAKCGGDLAAYKRRVEKWADQHTDGDLRGLLLHWEGKIALRKEDFETAVSTLRHAAETRSSRQAKLNSTIALGIALYEAYRLEEARLAAKRVREGALEGSYPMLEVLAELLDLQTRLRMGEAFEPDLELVELATEFGGVIVETAVRYCTAAALARIGERERAIEILEPTALREEPLRNNDTACLATGFYRFLKRERFSSDFIEEIQHCPTRRVRIELLALASHNETDPSLAEALTSEAREAMKDFEFGLFFYVAVPSEVISSDSRGRSRDSSTHWGGST